MTSHTPGTSRRGTYSAVHRVADDGWTLADHAMAPVGFDPKQVPDDAIRKLKSVLTVVDGKDVHNTMN